MVSIWIVEDDKNISEIESFALKNSGYDVTSFEDATSFYQGLQRGFPNLIILDIMLPDEDGLVVLEKMRNSSQTKKIPIILVTAKTTELDKVRGLDTGADDYLTKPFGIMELISRVNALLRRSGGITEDRVMSLGKIVLDQEKHTVTVDQKACDLTYKEFELIKLLLQNAGIVTGREDILNRIWGTDFEGESRTLDMHIKTLRQKLGEEGSHIKTIRNVGYILE